MSAVPVRLVLVFILGLYWTICVPRSDRPRPTDFFGLFYQFDRIPHLDPFFRAPRTIVRLYFRLYRSGEPFNISKITWCRLAISISSKIENGKKFFKIFKENLEIFFCFIQDRQDAIQQLQSRSRSYI